MVGWLVFTVHVGEETRTEERIETSWQAEGEINYTATIEESNPVYPVGTELTEQPAFPAELAPTVTGTITYGFEQADEGSLDVTMSIMLVREYTQTVDDVEYPIWREEEQLEHSTHEGLAPGDRAELGFELHALDALNRTEDIASAFGTRSGDTKLIITVEKSGEVNGESIANSDSKYLVLSEQDGIYTLISEGSLGDEVVETTWVEVPANPPLWKQVAGPLLLVLTGITGTMLFGARRLGWLTVSDHERQRLIYLDDREEFDEWIATIELPTSIYNRPIAEADSLQTLVEFAVDMNATVIEDPELGIFVVEKNGHLYVFDPPTDLR